MRKKNFHMVVHASAQIQRCRANPAHHVNNMHVGVCVCHVCVHAEFTACVQDNMLFIRAGWGDIFIMR